MDDQHLANSIRMILRGRDKDGNPVSPMTRDRFKHLAKEAANRLSPSTVSEDYDPDDE